MNFQTRDIEDYYNKLVDERLKDLKETVGRSRNELRDLWYKMILLDTGILGFSISLALGEIIQDRVNFTTLKFGWLFLLINIAIGLYLLTKESKLQSQESMRWTFYQMDQRDIESERKAGRYDKYKFGALVLLHGLRDGIKVSKLGYELINKYKKDLGSWNAIKDPERFYTPRDRNILIGVTNSFYISFGFSLAMLMFAVLL